MVTETEIAWAAGLFEGEGCLSISCNDSGSYCARFWLKMTDLDIVERFAKIMGVGVISEHKQKPHKTVYAWKIGKKKEVLRIMDMLQPYMGERRTEKFEEVREFYEFGW